jgi:hypothetical protein
MAQDDVKSLYCKWLRNVKAELFTRRGRSGIELGRRLESLGLPADHIELREVATRAAGIVPPDLDMTGLSWVRTFFREAEEWKNRIDQIEYVPTSGSIVDHILGGRPVSELLNEVVGESRFYYHCTTSDRFQSVAEHGLLPSSDPHWGGELGASSLHRVYLAKTPRQALYYCGIVFRKALENQEPAHVPVVLRVSRAAVKVVQDRESAQDVYATVSVPPSKLMFHRHGQWLPLQQGKGHIDSDMYYRATEGGFEDWEGGPAGNTPDAAWKNAVEMFSGIES